MLLLPEPFYHACTLFSGPNVRRQDEDQSTEIGVCPGLNLRTGVVIGEGPVETLQWSEFPLAMGLALVAMGMMT